MSIEGIICVMVASNLLLWIPGGALIGHLAKGRAGEGAGLGFVFGLLGWALIALLEDHRRLCQECRAVVPRDAKKCRYCGSVLTEPTANKPAPPPKTHQQKRQPSRRQPIVDAPSSMTGTAVSPHCGQRAMKTVEMGLSVLVCPQCGERP